MNRRTICSIVTALMFFAMTEIRGDVQVPGHIEGQDQIEWMEETIGISIKNELSTVVTVEIKSESGKTIDLTLQPKELIWFFKQNNGFNVVSLHYSLTGGDGGMTVKDKKQIRVAIVPTGLTPPSFGNEPVLLTQEYAEKFADRYIRMDDNTKFAMIIKKVGP